MEHFKILACINGYPPSETVVDYGAWLSKSLGSKLKLFHTLDQQYHENEGDLSGSIGLGAREEMLKEMVEIEHQQNKLLQQKAKLILEAAKIKALGLGAKEPELCLRKGKLVENAVELKDEIAVAVIGKYGQRHQSGEDRQAVGHKVESLVRSLRKPILMVSEKFQEPKSLCLAYDGSEGAMKTLEFLLNYKGSGMDIHIVYAGSPKEQMENSLQAAKKRLEERGFSAKTFILDGEPHVALPGHMDKNGIDILAMGAFGHNWLHDLVMGSLTSKMIRQTRRPLLLVR